MGCLPVGLERSRSAARRLPGEKARFTFLQSFGNPQSAHEVALAATEFAFGVEYPDVNGKQRTRPRGYVVQHPDELSKVDLYVDRIEVTTRRLWRWRKLWHSRAGLPLTFRHVRVAIDA